MRLKKEINNKINAIYAELYKIEREWKKECIKVINSYKTEYSMFHAMGSFAVYDKYGEPLSYEDYPKKIRDLEEIWSDIVSEFNYYMATEHIRQNKASNSQHRGNKQ